MPEYICRQCNKKSVSMVEISFGNAGEICEDCGIDMVPVGPTIANGMTVDNNAQVSLQKASFAVGGDMLNEGKFKAHDSDVTIAGHLINTGSMKINDPETIKKTLLEIASTAKDATAIGRLVLEKIFGVNLK